MYVLRAIGRRRPKLGWYGTFAKHLAYRAISGSSEGCVGGNFARAASEDAG